MPYAHWLQKTYGENYIMRQSKLIVTFCILLGICNLVQGQLRFGIRGAVGYMPAKSETNFAARINNSPADFKITFEEASPVYGFGLFVQDEIGWLYFQSEILFQSYQTQFTVRSFLGTDAILGDIEEKWNYLDWQVMAGLHIKNWRLGVGPVAHILVDQTSNFEDLSLYNEKLKGVTFGFLFSAGYNLGLFAIDLRYEKSFRSLGDHIWYDEFKSTFDGTPDILSLAIGFGF